jgi:hypothetical protein
LNDPGGFSCSSRWKFDVQEADEVPHGVTPGDPIGTVGVSAADLFTACCLLVRGCACLSERLDPSLRELLLTDRIRVRWRFV